MQIPTKSEIKARLLEEKAQYPALNVLNSTSAVAIYNLWLDVIAGVAFIWYSFLAVFSVNLDEKIRVQKRYSLLWYRDETLNFRYGHALLNGLYDDSNYTEAEIEASKVIKRAAVIEREIYNRKFLFIKVATEDGDGNLAPVSEEVMGALDVYFNDPEHMLKIAGTKIKLFTDVPDDLKLTIDFYYNPLLLDENGARIDGANNTPVQNVVHDYLKKLRFNGEFSIALLEDLLQEVDGCANREAYVRDCQANYLTPPEWQTINASFIANSGYMNVTTENLIINFIPKNAN